MEGHGHHHHHQQQQYLHHPFHPQPQPPPPPPPPPPVGDTADSRFPQWSLQETKEFLEIRAELDRTFMETKRNKLLWEVISTKMKDKGFHRSAEQCKCKWKNLVTRYKGCETMEAEAMRQQFPFYSELQAIFAARMQRMLWAEAAEGTAGPAQSTASKKNKAAAGLSSDEEETELEVSQGEKLVGAGNTSSRKRMKKGKSSSGNAEGSKGGGGAEAVAAAMKEVMEGFARQQMAMEMQWREAYEAREQERAAKEMEWRRTMEALEKERVMTERRWREREDQRRAREEARADKRDALITALLNKLTRDEHS